MKNLGNEVLDELLMESSENIEKIKRKEKRIQIAGWLIVLIQCSFVPFMGILGYQLETSNYDGGGSYPILTASLLTSFLSIPFVYSYLQKSISKKASTGEMIHRSSNFFAVLTLILGLLLIPIVIGLIYIYDEVVQKVISKERRMKVLQKH